MKFEDRSTTVPFWVNRVYLIDEVRMRGDMKSITENKEILGQEKNDQLESFIR